jgi:hypothetical protein
MGLGILMAATGMIPINMAVGDIIQTQGMEITVRLQTGLTVEAT